MTSEIAMPINERAMYSTRLRRVTELYQAVWRHCFPIDIDRSVRFEHCVSLSGLVEIFPSREFIGDAHQNEKISAIAVHKTSLIEQLRIPIETKITDSRRTAWIQCDSGERWQIFSYVRRTIAKRFQFLVSVSSWVGQSLAPCLSD